MWYDRDGLFAPITPEIAQVPMGIDPFRLDLGANWLSAVDDPELLKLWFPETLQQLLDIGFTQRIYVAQHWRELENEIVFDSNTATEIT